MERTDRLAGRFGEASRPQPLISFVFAYATLLPPSRSPSSNFLGGSCPIQRVVPVRAYSAAQGLQVAGQGLQLAAVVISLVLGLAKQLCVAGSSVCEVCKLNRKDLKLREGGLESPNSTRHRPGSCLGWEIPGKWGRPQGSSGRSNCRPRTSQAFILHRLSLHVRLSCSYRAWSPEPAAFWSLRFSVSGFLTAPVLPLRCPSFFS